MFLAVQTEEQINTQIEQIRANTSQGQRAVDDALKDLLDTLIRNDIHHGTIRRLLDERVCWDATVLPSLCEKGARKELIVLLLSDQREDGGITSDVITASLENAAGKGHVEIVRLLLCDPRMQPGDQSDTLSEAVYAKQLDVLDVLLGDERIDPNGDNGHALLCAADDARLVVLQRLLQDKRVNPRANNDEAVKQAAQLGEHDAMEMLIEAILVREGPEADHSLLWRRTMKRAVSQDRCATLRWLLERSGIKPSEMQWPLLQIAVRNNATDVARLLLDEYGLVPSEDTLSELIESTLVDHGKSEMFGLLLAANGVRPTKAMIRLALDHDRFGALEMLVRRFNEQREAEEHAPPLKRRKLDPDDV